MQEDGELVGFDIDLLEAVVDETEYELGEWATFEFDSLIPALTQNEEIDVIAAAMTITEDRQETIAFSDPYWESDQAILVREGGDFQPSAWEDFEGVSVGAQSGTTGADQVQSNLVDPGLVAEDDYRTYGSYVLAVEDLENENIDAVVIDLPVAETFAANRDVEIAFIEETGEQFGFGLRQGESEFQSALNDGLATVRDDGTYSGSRTPGSDRSRMSDPATLALAAVDSLGAAGAPSAAPGQPLIDFVSRLVGEAADWEFVFSNADYLGVGALLTIGLTAASILLGFVVGFPAGAVEVYGDGPLKRVVSAAGIVLRGTPIVVILIVMYFVVGVPQINLGVASISSAMTAGILGLGLRSAAYQSQIFRATLSSVDDGQLEAGRSIGLSRFEAVRYVVVPQALRRSIPGFQNEFTIVLKDTSIVFAIGLAELLTRGYDLFSEQTTAVLEVILFISAIYFVLTFTTNRALDRLGDYYAIPEGSRRE